MAWADEMRVGLIGRVRRVWAPRGMKVVQTVEYTRQWTYLNLRVNGLTGQVAWTWTSTMQSAAIAAVVTQWAAQGLAVLIWDQAPGHHGVAYQPRPLTLIALPPYSPELNPAERVFEYLRQKIEGRVYGTITAKQRALEAELQTLAAEPEAVKQLTGWAWIRLAWAQLENPTTTVD